MSRLIFDADTLGGTTTLSSVDAVGNFTIDVPAATGPLLIPTSVGTAGQALISSGTAVPIWQTASTGTVTSVSFTGGLISVANPTSTPALTVAGTSGGVPYFTSASTWASSAVLAANALMIGGGAGATPATTATGTGVVTALGTNIGTAGSFVLNGGVLGTPSSGTVTNLTGTASININGTVGATTPATVVATQVDITAQGYLRLQDTTGGEYVAIQAPATLASNYTLTMPADDGTAGQALITDGSGVLSWSTAASGDVYGPASATDNAIARFDLTTGKIIQNSVVTIADTTGNMAGVGTLSSGAITSSALTAGRVPYAGTAGLIQDAAALTFDGTILSATRFAGALNGTVGATTPSTGAFTTLSASTQLNLTNASDYNLYASGAGNNYFAGSVGIGATPSAISKLYLGGTYPTSSTLSYVAYMEGTIPSGTTGATAGFVTSLSTQAAAFNLSTLSHFQANQGTIGATSTIGSQYGFFAQSNLTGATNNYGFYGAIASGTGRFNFYANGTAANVFVGTTSLGGAVGSESLRVTPVASAVNYWDFYGGATGVDPYFFPSGSDTNRGFIYLTKGAGTHRFMTGSSLTNTQFAISNTASAVNYITVFGNSAGSGGYFQAAGSDTNISMLFSAKGTGNHDFYTAGNSFTRQFVVAHTASAVNYLQVTGGDGTTTSPRLQAVGSSANITFQYLTKGTGEHNFYTNGAHQFNIANTTSAVNYLQVTGAATGGSPVLSAQGSDAAISLIYQSKSSGAHFFQTGGSNQFLISHVASAVNYVGVQGGATTQPALIYATGSDTNIDLALTPKGTGVLAFGTYTAGIIAQAGSITIKDAAGTTRRLLVG